MGDRAMAISPKLDNVMSGLSSELENLCFGSFCMMKLETL